MHLSIDESPNFKKKKKSALLKSYSRLSFRPSPISQPGAGINSRTGKLFLKSSFFIFGNRVFSLTREIQKARRILIPVCSAIYLF
jgi:hypothetical protein